MGGWIKLHRKLMDDAVWTSCTPEQKTIFITLLLMANHKEKEWVWKGQKFKAQPGQFVTSIDSIKKNAGRKISYKNVRTALDKFEKLGILANESTKTGRLITIVNWGKYQTKDDEGGKDNGSLSADNRQSIGSQSAPNKNVRREEGKNNNIVAPLNKLPRDNNNKYIYPDTFEQFWNIYPRNKEKTAAYTFWHTRVKEGHTPEQLLEAAEKYKEECEKQGTETRYIKHAKTFLGDKKPFLDYIEDEPQDQDQGKVVNLPQKPAQNEELTKEEKEAAEKRRRELLEKAKKNLYKRPGDNNG